MNNRLQFGICASFVLVSCGKTTQEKLPNIVYILADDLGYGPHLEGGADPEYFNSNGGLRGFKRDLYEGGIRTPMLVKWPENVKKGTTSNPDNTIHTKYYPDPDG